MSGFKDFDQTTPANNASVGPINFTEGQVPSTVNNSMRQLMTDLRLGLAGAEHSAASATTVDLSLVESNNVKITGTTTIADLGVQSAGIEKTLRFTDSLIITHSVGGITVPGASNLSVHTADSVRVISDGGGAWRILNYRTDRAPHSTEFVTKTAIETVNSSTTLQDDDALTVSIGANEVVLFNLSVFFNSGTTPDFKFAMTGPSGSTGKFSVGNVIIDASGSATSVQAASLGSTISVGGNNSANLQINITGICSNGATPGNLRLQWAQDTSDAGDTSVLTDSFMVVWRA